jgi:hypothetical protein
MDRDDPGRSRGFGFVTVSGMDLAQEVIRQTDGQDLMVCFWCKCLLRIREVKM